MRNEIDRSAIVVTSWPGQASRAELERLAAAGEQPRKDYVELARLLNADVIDSHHMAERATLPARWVESRVGIVQGQIAETFLRRGEYRHIIAWADRLGLPLGLLFKLTRSRRDLVLISVWLSHLKKAVFLKPLKAHTHLGAIINYGSKQMEIAADRLGVPRDKLHLALQPVDERFWRPNGTPVENIICSVGSEARDYPTLINAIRGLDLGVDLAVGSTVLRPSGDAVAMFTPMIREISGTDLPPNVRVHRGLEHRKLRGLYCRSRFVVVPLHDIEFDAGVTALTEAMAMGKAVIVTRTRGQIDLIRDGEQGIYVPPGDPAALRTAIAYLHSHPEEAERMGRAGRALVEHRHTLDAYVERVAAIVWGTDEAGIEVSGRHRADAHSACSD
ncbi:MAG: glycosyltransferase [Chloroflexota bacterium]|nr:glycosyltransferase [Chloroflexota bacterium]